MFTRTRLDRRHLDWRTPVRRVLLTLYFAMCLPLAACASSPDGLEPTTAEDLDGMTFVSTEVTGHDLVPDTQVLISFEDGRMSASAGCNTLSAGFTVHEGSLTLDGQPASTMMGCQDDLALQDGWLAGFLSEGPTPERDGDTLTLTGGEVTVTMLDQAVAEPAKPLTGTRWTLDSIVDGETVSSVPANVDLPTLQLTENGEATVSTGCNRGGASVDIGDATLTFGPMRLTKMACQGEGPTVEAAVVAVLDGEVEYTIEGLQLSITNGEQGLVYRTS